MNVAPSRRQGSRYLGVDAGNSKTDAVVCDATGRVRGRGRAGCGDIYNDGVEPAVEAVLSAVDKALGQADAKPENLAGAAFRLAGVDWPEDHALWTETIRRRLPKLRAYSVANDGFAAIRCGEPSGVAVAVVAGTGSAIVGRGPDGVEHSLSFWIDGGMGAGGLVGDALRAIYRAELRLGPATALTERLLAYFGHDDVERLLHGFTRRERRHTGPRIAAAAPEVIRAASTGDAIATGILTDHAERYADYARTAARRVGFDVETGRVPVVLAGSVLTAPGSPLLAEIQLTLARRFPVAAPRTTQLPPVGGATLDALAEADVPLSASAVAALGAGLAERTHDGVGVPGSAT